MIQEDCNDPGIKDLVYNGDFKKSSNACWKKLGVYTL